MKNKKYTNQVVFAQKTYGLILCKTGKINGYRLAFLKGEGAGRHEKTFNPDLGVRGGHSCCGSKVEWRHKAKCKNALRNAPADYSDLKDPDLI